MKHKWKLRNRSISIKMFSSFAIIALAAVVISGLLTYTLAAREIESQISASSRQVLENISNTVEMTLDSMKSDLYMLSLSDEVDDYLQSTPFKDKYTPKQLDAFYSLVSKLDTAAALGDVAHSIMMYSNVHGTIVGANESVDIEPGYVEKLTTGRWQVISSPTEHKPVLWYVHRVLTPVKQQYAALIVEIELGDIEKTWDISDAGRLYVLDGVGNFVRDGEIDSADNGIIQLADKDSRDGLVNYYSANDSVTIYKSDMGWKYVKIMSLGESMRELNFVRNITFSAMAIIIALLLIFIYTNSKRIAQPINKMTAELGIAGGDEIKHINEFIQDMKSQHDELSHMLEKYGRKYDSERSLKMLRTPAPSMELIDDFVVGTRSVNCEYCAAIIQIDDAKRIASMHNYEDFEVMRLSMMDILGNMPERHARFAGCHFTETSSGIIFYDTELNREELIAVLKKFIENVKSWIGFSISIGISEITETPEGIYDAGQYATRALNGRFNAGWGHVHMQADLHKAVEYPQISSRKLAGELSASGNADDSMLLTPLLEALGSGDVELDYLHAWTASLLLRIDSALREMYSSKYHQVIDQNLLINRTFSIETQAQLIDVIESALSDMARPFQMDTDGLHPQIEKVLAYIDAHLSEDFSQTDAANSVDLNASYFSTLFKQEIGKPFLQYVQECRIARAKELIASEDTTLDAIGRAVGFVTPNSFIRTFKKLEGMTPGQYKAEVRREK